MGWQHPTCFCDWTDLHSSVGLLRGIIKRLRNKQKLRVICKEEAGWLNRSVVLGLQAQSGRVHIYIYIYTHIHVYVYIYSTLHEAFVYSKAS